MRTGGWLADRFELQRGGAAANLRPMEGLRGFAVLLVFFVHYATLASPWMVPGSATAGLFALAHDIGHAGVDLFFVLSGHLIYSHLLSKPVAFGPYFVRRLWRIYPTFLAVFAIYLVLSFALPSQSKLPDGAAATALYLLQNLLLLPGLLPIEPLITVAWSLSYEMFYYLVMPTVVVAAALRRRSPTWRLVFFVLLLAVGLLAAAAWGGPVRLGLFLAGVLLADATRRLRPGVVGTGAAVLGLAAVAVVMALPMPGPALQSLRTAVLCIGFFVLCLACFHHPRAAVARVFAWTPLRWLGNMSYSYYLIHGLTLKAFFVVLAQLGAASALPGAAVLYLLPAFAATIGVGCLLFLCVERPWSLAAGATLRPPALQPVSKA